MLKKVNDVKHLETGGVLYLPNWWSGQGNRATN
jgi:hypothetical protein